MVRKVITSLVSIFLLSSNLWAAKPDRWVTQYDDFISRIRTDLNIAKPIFILIVSKYESDVQIRTAEDRSESCWKIVFHVIEIYGPYYKSLESEEIKAVVAHEAEHIKELEKISCLKNRLAPSERNRIEEDIRADTLAARYIDPVIVKRAIQKSIKRHSPLARFPGMDDRMGNLDRLIRERKQSK